MKFIRHIPDTMAKVVHGLISEWKVLQVRVKIDGKHGSAPGGTLVSVAGIEISCFNFFYGVKVHENSVWEKIKQSERDLMFQNHKHSFYSSKPLLIRLFHGWTYLQVGYTLMVNVLVKGLD